MMVSLTQIPNFLDDAELLRVAAPPRSPLFPVLNRASAFAPLIMVCCVLPAFQLLANPPLNEEASYWGLRALAVAQSTTLQEALNPGVNESAHPMTNQPPLAAWLNGLMIHLLGPTNPFSTRLVSLVATGIAIWLISRMAWRVGGANIALISAVLMSCHPQTIEMAITPGYDSIGVLLMMATVFGFQRHLEGKSVLISPSLAVSGIVWGLAVLAVGPVAIAIPLVFILYALNQRVGNQPEFSNPSLRDQLIQGQSVLRSLLFLVGIGLLVSGWWGFVIGIDGFHSWWTSVPIDALAKGNGEWKSELRPLIQPSWNDWLIQQSLVITWLIVGLERSWHVYRRPGSELIRRRYQLVLFWWTIGILGRSYAEFLGTFTVANTEIWNLALLTPTVLLSAIGIGAVIERAVSRRGEFFLIVLLVSLTAARFSMSWLVGLAAGAFAATFLIFVPMLFSTSARTEHGWTQQAWRQLLQVTIHGSLIACLSLGLGFRSVLSEDQNRCSELRNRIRSFPEVRRISLIATRDPVPMTLRFLLRCRWPAAELVTGEGWDAGLTTAMDLESKSPQSRFLIVEWTRRDIRFSANTGLQWRIKAIGEPMRFQGLRLSLILVEPQS